MEAKKVESEHQARLQTLQQQMEWLRQQEEHLHQVIFPNLGKCLVPMYYFFTIY